MCGITGIFRYKRRASDCLDEAIGLRMTDSLIHRGPDSGGLLVANDVMLGHRRLSILDVSEDGHQPMSDPHARCWMTYNGEIYNYKELRRELETTGHRFVSQTDSEVLLLGYLQWGCEVVNRVRGMFAFAIWDTRDQSLFAARDPVGIKPFFYHDDGESFRFGSEIKAILADPQIPRPVDWRAIDRFLALGYMPAPLTGFSDIHSLLPGHWIRVTARGAETHEYFEMPYPAGPQTMSMEDAVDRLSFAIDQSVERQMVSDVPLGAMLSGGLDSSAVVRAMRRASNGELHAFTTGFSEKSFDESGYASQVASTYQVKHTIDRIDDRAADWLPTIVSHSEEPLADNSAIAFFDLSRSVRRHVTVALSGDGADELLSGYDTYRASQLAAVYRRLPAALRRSVMQPLVARLPRSSAKYSLSMLLTRFVNAAGNEPPYDHCNWRRMLTPALRVELSTGPLRQDEDPMTGYAEAIQSGPSWLSRDQRNLHGDFRFHLPNDLLVKVDRMSMAHSLEVRVPLLDLQVVEACLAIPYELKRIRGDGKRVLKAMLRRELPAHVVDRRKSGFLVPLERWLSGPWQRLVRENLDDRFAEETGAFDPAVLRRMLNQQAEGRADHSYALFALLILAMWWQIWITQERPVSVMVPPNAKPTRVQRAGQLY